jgi:hypothetical protein
MKPDSVVAAVLMGLGAVALKRLFSGGMRRNSDPKEESQRRLASSQGARERDLARMADSPYPSVRLAVVRNGRSSVDIVSYLASDSDQQVRAAVAASGKASPEAQERLASDSRAAVRMALARSRATSAAVLRKLAKDGDSYVRLAVAQNFSSTNDILRSLHADSDGEVRAESRLTLSRKIRSER